MRTCDKDKAEFLRRYEALCREYRLVVDACGCCDSPWLKSWEGNWGEDGEWGMDEEGREVEFRRHIEHLREWAGLKES